MIRYADGWRAIKSSFVASWVYGVAAKRQKNVLQQEAYPAVRPPVYAQNSAIPGAIDLSDTPLEPGNRRSFLNIRLADHVYLCETVFKL